MKRVLFFLIVILSLNIVMFTNVKAESFYEGDYIDGIYMTREKGGTRYYQKARFFMHRELNKFSYCIEPFATFNESGIYQGSLTTDNLNASQMELIHKVIHFGYQYPGHGDSKWYAITQFMIWKIADPSADYYFTDRLDGNRIDIYQNEMAEIYQLIAEYEKIPTLAGQEIDLVEDHTTTLTDLNQVLSKYQSNSNFATIEGNQLKIHDLKEGDYTIDLTRKEALTLCVPLFFNSTTSQNMATQGDLNPIHITLKVHVHKTSIEVTKTDSDTKDTTPSGEASLSGAIYSLYDADMKEIAELTIDDNMKAMIENLGYGKYFIKEKEAGVGYQLDDDIYEVMIDRDHLNIELTLENKVIKKTIQIHKNYGEDNNFMNEENISFEVRNSKNELVDTITTNQNGLASITLPFGKYVFSQINTSDGYKMVNNFNVDVKDEKTEKIELYDYKIKVPNTETSDCSFLLIILIGLLYVKKMVFI